MDSKVAEYAKLEQHIDYAVIGAMAASVHGVVCASIHADAVIAVGLARLRAVEAEFSAADSGRRYSGPRRARSITLLCNASHPPMATPRLRHGTPYSRAFRRTLTGLDDVVR
jgi:hypothetical protein